MNIPNFNNLARPMSQFGKPQSIQQGYSNTVSNGLPAYQQMLAMQRQTPALGRYIQGLTAKPVAGRQQYQQAQSQSVPMTEFAAYLARQGGGDPRAILQDIAANGLQKYGKQLGEYGAWKDAETKRANASGMLASGIGSMIPGLAMAAFPGAGLMKIAQGALMGGMGGGVKGALLGGVASAVAPSLKMPGIKAITSAPIQSIKGLASQMTPMNTARLLASRGIGRMQDG